MVLEGLDSSFGWVCSVVARGDELIFDAGLLEVLGEGVGDLIIEANRGESLWRENPLW